MDSRKEPMNRHAWIIVLKLVKIVVDFFRK